MRRLTLAVAMAAGLAPEAGAQQAPTRTPVFRAGLEMVNVTASVRDSEGNLVSGLGPGDFVLREDGRRQRIVLFARALEPGNESALALDLGLLMDTSQSMVDEIKLSQHAAVRFLESIPRARELYVVFFDQDIRLSRYDSEHQQGLFERIAEMKGGGNTALYDAIAVYLSRVQYSRGRKVLVLFTDGVDSTSSLSLSEVVDLVRSSSVTIYAVAFTGSERVGSSRYLSARAFLNQLARMTGGTVFMPRASRELAEVYEKILSELTNQYVLGFVSDNPRRDGKFRKLEVDVKRGRYDVRHRRGYYAPQ